MNPLALIVLGTVAGIAGAFTGLAGGILKVDYKASVIIGIGGILGAQISAQLVGIVPVDVFKKVFAAILVILAVGLVV